MEYHSKLQFLERILGKSKYSRNTKEAGFFCPFCNHHRQKLFINLDTDYWQCFPCGKVGRTLGYLLKSAGGSRADVKEYYERYKSNKVVDDTFRDDSFSVSLPSSFVPVTECRSSLFGRHALRYLLNIRGIEAIDVVRYKIGIALDGKYENSVIFPSFNREGRLNFFTARYYDGRKMEPKVPRGYKNTIILNELNIDWDKPIVLVEGPIDMLKSTPNTVPLFGSSLRIESLLFQTIVKHQTPVILGLDADALKKRFAITENLNKYNIPTYTIDFGEYGDIGEMSKQEAASRLGGAQLSTKKSVFRERLRMLC